MNFRINPAFVPSVESEDWKNWCLVYRDRIVRENVIWTLDQNYRALAELIIAEYNDQPWAQCQMEITRDGAVMFRERKIDYRVRALEDLSQAKSGKEEDRIIEQFNRRQLGVNLVRGADTISFIENQPVGDLIRRLHEPMTQELLERREEVAQRLNKAMREGGSEGFREALEAQWAQVRQREQLSHPQSLARPSLSLVRRGSTEAQTPQSKAGHFNRGSAVLVEALSVIVRRDAVEKRFTGGWHAFLGQVPNRTLCISDDFARVGFMSPEDVKAYVTTLKDEGLVFREDGKAVDFAVVDQLRGPTFLVPWLEFGKIEIGVMKISACWPAGHVPKEIATPAGWTYENSLSAKPNFFDENTIDDRLKFVRRKDGLDVYLDLRTGKELFIGRPNIEGESSRAISTRLEGICHEVLDIDARMQPLLTQQDDHGLATLFHRLNSELLPSVHQIVGGGGRQMAFAHFTFGLILRMLHRQEEAERAFRKANELQPAVINTLLELVRCLGEQDKHREALLFAREAVDVGPESAGAWGNLAMCLISCGEREEAREAIDYAIELDPQDAINLRIRDNIQHQLREARRKGPAGLLHKQQYPESEGLVMPHEETIQTDAIFLPMGATPEERAEYERQVRERSNQRTPLNNELVLPASSLIESSPVREENSVPLTEEEFNAVFDSYFAEPRTENRKEIKGKHPTEAKGIGSPTRHSEATFQQWMRRFRKNFRKRLAEKATGPR